MTHHTNHTPTPKPLLEEDSPHSEFIIRKRFSRNGWSLIHALKSFRGDRDCLLVVETDLEEIVRKLGEKAKSKHVISKVSEAYRHLWIRHNGPLSSKCLEVANNIDKVTK